MRKGQIDYAPITDHVEPRGGIKEVLAEAGIRPGTNQFDRIRMTYANASKRGHASVFHVDEVCCDVLGKHPSELYGRAWFEAA